MNLRSYLLGALVVPALLTGCQNNGGTEGGAKVDAEASRPSMPASSGDISPDTTVATINGEAIKYKDLESNSEFTQQVAKFKTEQAQRLYQLNSAGVGQLVESRLIDMEAKAQGKTTEQYVKDEITAKVTQPTDADLQDLYNRFRRRMRGTFEENKTELQERFVQQQEAQIRQELIGKLREKYKVEITLPYPELPRLPVSVDDDPSMGGASAPVTIVEFSEFQCPYCKRVEPTIKQIRDTYGDKVKVVFRDFPLEFHQFAAKAAEAGECADEQGKFWEMHATLFENQRALSEEDIKGYAKNIPGLNAEQFESCFTSGKYAEEVAKDIADGQAVGVTGTPAFFINGQLISGALPFDMFKAIIDSELARVGG